MEDSKSDSELMTKLIETQNQLTTLMMAQQQKQDKGYSRAIMGYGRRKVPPFTGLKCEWTSWKRSFLATVAIVPHLKEIVDSDMTDTVEDEANLELYSILEEAICDVFHLNSDVVDFGDGRSVWRSMLAAPGHELVPQADTRR